MIYISTNADCNFENTTVDILFLKIFLILLKLNQLIISYHGLCEHWSPIGCRVSISKETL